MASDTVGTPVKIASAVISGVLLIIILVVILQGGDDGDAGAEGTQTEQAEGNDDAQSSPDAAAGACTEPVSVQVTTTDDLAPVVESAAARLESDGGACADYTVTATPSANAAEQIGSGGAEAPHVWIPDSHLWVERANQSREDEQLLPGTVVATSPVVIAVPQQIAESADVTGAQPWASLLGGDLPVRMSDPEQSTASLVTLMSASQAFGGTFAGQQALGRATIALSRQVAPDEELFAAAGSGGGEATAFPASEQEVFSHNADNPDGQLVALVPADGIGAYSYPWVPVATGEEAPSGQMGALLDELTGEQGMTELASAGFRTTDGQAPGVPGMPPELPEALPMPPIESVDQALRSWQAVSVDMRMLAVIDVSGSMRQPVGAQSRIELAAGSAQAAMQLFPPTSQVGLWEFSTNRDGNQDWQQRAPIAQLDAERGEGTHRDALLAAAGALPGRVGGDTGLYDTLLAAYREVQRTHDPNYINSVVLLTDGMNDDANSISLTELLAELEELSDPERPVVVITVGMGTEAEADVLRRISELTGGTSYIAEDPADIATVFVDALLQRG